MLMGILLVMAWATVWRCITLEDKPHKKLDENGDEE